ncbi:polarity establishment and bud formation protein [Scheffersomyces stipitis CBS 6054]|uniref:Polarity establishment and bud formation protein n=1 Tax=Scheffersomyces stipitis (strain ATCC 58785 / CBS 6054 / NBRC 10063 / NRRL Y-11545) TaxID=322104 RepID=A3LX57_PICST|nr:polarity establishment and bud formation protein [Scheffersomyces stipitis CBS 6054]ABN67741.2 polarity establishment and bud formation protein [Scheffersomyces stipitis CBS 6054]
MAAQQTRRADFDLPKLPDMATVRKSANLIRPEQFSKRKLKSILHLITAELKARGTNVPHILLPFRSKINDSKLEQFLEQLFPNGELIDVDHDENHALIIIQSYDEFTLICALKYMWSRLPNNEIIGWDVYLEYRRREREAGYPKNAFLSIMPKCLSSPAHASIVYDFLDLLISITSNSQYNYLSGRKVTKMASIWAFNPTSKLSKSAFYDATINQEFNFIQGVEAWKSSGNALFHLLLSFLRAMLPENDAETLKLPKALQSLLITTAYPPSEDTGRTLKSMITIPCVVVKSTRPSSNVYELLSKVRHTLSFDKKDAFLSIENYTILKNIFKKDSTDDIVRGLTEESRRVLGRLTDDSIESKYELYPGWPKSQPEIDDNIPLFSQVSVYDVTLQDFYIWTWLSTLGSDQSTEFKKIFGRSLVMESDLKGFQKWIIISEQTMSSDEYLKHFKLEPVQTTTPPRSRNPSNESIKRKNSPLPPLPPKDFKHLDETVDPLPNISFEEKDYKLDVGSLTLEDDQMSYIYPSKVSADEASEYRRYLETTSIAEVSIQTRSRTNSTVPIPRKVPPSSDFDINSAPSSSLSLGQPCQTPVTQYSSNTGDFKEPFDSYTTEQERKEMIKQNKSDEPFEDYYVPGTGQSPMELLERHQQLNSPVSEQSLDKAKDPIDTELASDTPKLDDKLDAKLDSKFEAEYAESKEAKKERRRMRKEKKEKLKREKEVAEVMAAAAAAAGFTDTPEFASVGTPPIRSPPGSFAPPDVIMSPVPESPKRVKDKSQDKEKKKKKKKKPTSYVADEKQTDYTMALPPPQPIFNQVPPPLDLNMASHSPAVQNGIFFSPFSAPPMPYQPQYAYHGSQEYLPVPPTQYMYHSSQEQLSLPTEYHKSRGSSPQSRSPEKSHTKLNSNTEPQGQVYSAIPPQQFPHPQQYLHPQQYSQQYLPHNPQQYLPHPPQQQKPSHHSPALSSQPQYQAYQPVAHEPIHHPNHTPAPQPIYLNRPSASNHHPISPPHSRPTSDTGSGGKHGVSDFTMMSIPKQGKHNKNSTTNKANLRAAFIQGSFGI